MRHKVKYDQDEDIFVENVDSAALEYIVVDETETRTSNRIKRQEQAEDWWSANWEVIEKSYLIAAVGVLPQLTCQCLNRKRHTALDMSLECS